jgi:hypothetical protein
LQFELVYERRIVFGFNQALFSTRPHISFREKSKMKKVILAAASCLMAAQAFATPTPLNESQMDNVTAGVAPSPTGFVCPVISTDNVLNSPKGGTLGDTGDYTIGGPVVSVPTHATNGDGAGVPAGPHSAPGDTDYTAIWSFQ